MVYRKLQVELRDLLSRKRKKYVRQKAVDLKVQEMLDKGLFPLYGRSPEDNHRENQLKQLIKHLYAADLRGLTGIKDNLIRVYLGLLDLLLQTERRSDILHVIDRAIRLSEKEQKRIADVLSQ